MIKKIFDISALFEMIENSDCRDFYAMRLNECIKNKNKYTILVNSYGAKILESLCFGSNNNALFLELSDHGKMLLKRISTPLERYDIGDLRYAIVTTTEEFDIFIRYILGDTCDDDKKYSYILLGELNARSTSSNEQFVHK